MNYKQLRDQIYNINFAENIDNSYAFPVHGYMTDFLVELEIKLESVTDEAKLQGTRIPTK